METDRMRLRLVMAVAGMLMAFGFPPPGLADSVPLVGVDPTSPSLNAGSSFTVDVDITNVADLYAFQFDLSFAPGIMSAVAITEGSFLPAGGSTFFIPGTVDDTAGSVAATADTLLGPGSGVTGSGTVAVLTVKGVSAGTTSIDLSNVLLLDSNLNPIPFDLQGGSVTVTTVVAAPEPGSLCLILAAAGILIFFRRR